MNTGLWLVNIYLTVPGGPGAEHRDGGLGRALDTEWGSVRELELGKVWHFNLNQDCRNEMTTNFFHSSRATIPSCGDKMSKIQGRFWIILCQNKTPSTLSPKHIEILGNRYSSVGCTLNVFLERSTTDNRVKRKVGPVCYLDIDDHRIFYNWLLQLATQKSDVFSGYAHPHTCACSRHGSFVITVCVKKVLSFGSFCQDKFNPQH